MLKHLLDGIVAVLLAPECAVCHDPLDEPTRSPVCRRCWASVRWLRPPFCEACGDPLSILIAHPGRDRVCDRCRTSRRPVAVARSVAEYEGAMRAILHALKYDGRRSLAPALSALMREHGSDALAGADCCVPVPLHWRRRWKRGFNQAAELARGLRLPVMHALVRRRHTAAQADLPADARRRNVRAAFGARRSAPVRGLCVVLVDDVSTTGATLEACAGELIAAGAGEVRTLTAARVVTAPPRGRPR